ncbi:MAG: acetyl-CoA carboxylase, biotin carboxyl carrier protein [Candidatus Poribacteria bacterium]|nr:MAG: acetyl-CoA carboxylase, biotin carboxyl carrier protein [Candidatus Poribacteria bacterium]
MPKRSEEQKELLEELRELAEFMREYELTELEVEHTEYGRNVRMRRGGPEVVPLTAAVPQPAAAAPGPAAEQRPEPTPTTQEALEVITAPMVGTFYRSPRPGDPPFVEIGSRVQPGDVLCIIEAMKLMNHIEAEFPAEIVEILVENATMVEYGTPLFRVRRLS